jgi:predicted component of type VI protein secretion system
MRKTKVKPNKTVILSAVAVAALLGLAGCEGVKPEASYPNRQEGSDKLIYSDEKRDTIWGEGTSLGDRLFRSKETDTNTGIGVNSFLWRASLDTISFMPIASADPFGGVILTDWYENPETPGERYKLNIYILDRQLRADGVRVAVFKQQREGGTWRDTKVAPEMATNIENTVLTRARELRVAQMGMGRN